MSHEQRWATPVRKVWVALVAPMTACLLLLVAVASLGSWRPVSGGNAALPGPPIAGETMGIVGGQTGEGDLLFAPVDLTMATAPTSSVVMTEGFESSWPDGKWWILTQGSFPPPYEWGKRDCHPHTGQYGAWTFGGGLYGPSKKCDTLGPPSFEDTWAMYGPLDLSDAVSVTLSYYLWGEGLETDDEDEYLSVGSALPPCSPVLCVMTVRFETSANYRNGPDGNGYTLIRHGLPEAVGASQAWIVFAFNAGAPGSVHSRGYTVDDITLEVIWVRRVYLPALTR